MMSFGLFVSESVCIMSLPHNYPHHRRHLLIFPSFLPNNEWIVCPFISFVPSAMKIRAFT